MFEIEFVAPVAVCYPFAASAARLMFCDAQTFAPVEELRAFFLDNVNYSLSSPIPSIGSSDTRTWSRHQIFPEVTIGPRLLPDGQLVYGQLDQPIVNFYFTTKGQDHDFWHVWMTPDGSLPVAISESNSSHGDGVINPLQPHGGLMAERHGWLQPHPPAPSLPIYATDTTSLQRWNSHQLPFRVQHVSQPISIDSST